MEKIYFDESTFIWKEKLNLIELKSKLLSEVEYVVNDTIGNVTDGYVYTPNLVIGNELDGICQFGITKCKELYDTEIGEYYNKVNTDLWINIVRCTNPKQSAYKSVDIKRDIKYHTHINRKRKVFNPYYTFVYYIQMPDVMINEDGVLYIRGKNKKEYWIRPEEDDLIIMKADLPHSPNVAPNSNIDRIVIAGSVGFDFIKNQKTLI